jgi:rod shape determining protein RodA
MDGRFAGLIVLGVTLMLGLQAAFNMAVVSGLLPPKGIQLPFVSYGGSSLWSFTILLFILLKFDSARKGLSAN